MRHLQAVRMGTVQLNEQLAWEPLGRQSLDRRLPVLDQVARGAEYRKLAVRSALNSPEVTHMGFWSINPYIGCEFGCTYCYARDTHRFTVERAVAESADAPDTRMVRRPATEAFERHILVKDRLHDIICRTLEPARIGHTAIVIGTATDPYQPAERRYGATRGVLQALLRFEGLHLGIITKSPLIMRDLDLLAEVSARHSLRVNISLASVDREMIRRLEARSPAPAARLRALSALRQRGIRAGIMMAPIVPMLTDTMRSLRNLFEAGVAAGAQAQPVAGEVGDEIDPAGLRLVGHHRGLRRRVPARRALEGHGAGQHSTVHFRQRHVHGDVARREAGGAFGPGLRGAA